jgi:hypothetical protein
VLEATPATDIDPINPTHEIFCPGPQTVVFTESAADTFGTINGNRAWGNRPVVGYLVAETDEKTFSFVSAITFQDTNGSIPLRFGQISPAIGTRKVKSWYSYIFVDKLRTDYSYSIGDPYINCALHIDSTFVPYKAPKNTGTTSSSASTSGAPQSGASETRVTTVNPKVPPILPTK